MNTQNKLWLSIFFAGVITVAAFSGIAEASEFLADFIIKGEMMSDGLPGNTTIADTSNTR
jgi:hypothetical protein